MLTLVADLRSHSHPAIPPGFQVRACTRADRDPLGHLYFEAYKPGDACEKLTEAIDDIEASFNGDYGEFWFEASPVVEHDGWIVPANMTTRRAPWDNTPDAPFIIELFTARRYRRRGLARLLLNECMATLLESGATAVALRVGADNAAARSLYESLGFREGPA
ncbi:MAG: GNAT family N-acetyltransferase [Acidimicrobiia bacterium]